MTQIVTTSASTSGTTPGEIVLDRTANPPAPVDSKLTLTPGGRFFLHTEWMGGVDEKNGVEISLDSGSGMGSGLMQVRIEKDGKVHYWHVNMSDWLQAFVTEQLAAGLPTDGSTGLITTRTGEDGKPFESSSY